MIVKIGDVISEYSVRNKFDENIPVYSVTNEKGFCTGYFSKEVASKDKSTYKIVPRGYFAYNPSRINVGSVDWQKYEDRVIVSPLYVVFGVSDRLDRQYLLHYLKSDMMLSFIKEYATGSVRDHLKLADLGKFPINLRPVEEQRQIATTLDKIDDLIAKRRQQLDKLDELVKSRFIEMFGVYPANPMGWEIGTIRDIVTEVRYGSSRPAVDGGKYPYLRMNNITYGGELDLSDTKRIDIPDNELDKCTVRRGDILFNRTNSKELVGKTCVYDRDEMMVLAGFVIRIRVKDRILPEFLSALTQTFQNKCCLECAKRLLGRQISTRRNCKILVFTCLQLSCNSALFSSRKKPTNQNWQSRRALTSWKY